MTTYKDAGVDIDEATKAVNLIKPIVASTRKKDFVDAGLFGGMFDSRFLKEYEHPILVPSTDGVGTKIITSQVMNKWTVGQCLINHCANDILTMGAKPLFVLDYQGHHKLKAEYATEIVRNMAIACKEMDIEISGGELAEMYSIYKEDRIDLVCAMVGVVEKSQIINGTKINEDDLLIGLPSTGLHTNGYTLAHEVFSLRKYDYIDSDFIEELGCTLGEEYLKIHKSYVNPVLDCLKQGIHIHGIAHITGGGFYDNIERILPKEVYALINKYRKILPVFQVIQNLGNVATEEMFHTFNMGIGMVLIVSADQYGRIKAIIEDAVIIGEIKKKQHSKEESVVIDII